MEPSAGGRGGSVGRESSGMEHVRILIAEDDIELRQVMAEYLFHEGCRVTGVSNGEDVFKAISAERPDLLILDWMLPGLSGLEVARRLRSEGDSLPIVMVTARGEEPDVVLGLELGADDYLVKPVSLRQLAARVRAVLRRTQPGSTVEDWVHVGAVRIDFRARTVERDGVEIPLTATEFEILSVLVRDPGRVFSRLQILEGALGTHYEGYERTIDSHISHLRKKLGGEPRIETVHGIGYKAVAPR